MTPLTSAAAAWLATYAIHSTLLLGLAWLVLRLRRADAATANLLWKVALVGGVVTASVQSALDIRPAGSWEMAARPAEQASSAPTTSNVGSESSVPTGAAGAQLSTLDSRPSTPSSRPSTRSARPSTLDSGPSTSDLRLSTFLVWAAIATLLLLWYSGRRLVLVGRLGDRRPVREGPLAARLGELCRLAGVRRPISLTASAAISSPVALGSGEICLPTAALEDLAPEQQHAMLAHELAHLVRRDPQWLVIACVMERAFFFQPLNRLARRGMMESAEYLADDWAAGRSGHVPLARCLVKVAEWIQASPLGVPMAGMAEERSQLATRVSRLLENPNKDSAMPRYAAPVLAALALAGTVAFVPGAAAISRDVAAPATEAALPSSILPGGDALADTGLSASGSLSMEAGVSLQDGPQRPATRPVPDPDPSTTRKGGSTVLPDTAVVRALVARLSDEDAEVRRAAADALGRIENPIAIPGLVKALDDTDRDVRRAALDALGQFEKGVPADPIRRMLTADDPEMRREAAEMLGEMRDRPSRAAIETLVSDPDAEVRHEALHALAHINDPASVKVVTSAVSDANAEVRRVAFETLEEMKADVDPAVVSRGFADQNSEVREAAVELAESRRMASLSGQLARLLDDPSSQVREGAAEALTEMGTQEARTALQAAMTHADPKVRRVAVEFFGEEND